MPRNNEATYMIIIYINDDFPLLKTSLPFHVFLYSFRYLPYILIVDLNGNILHSRTFDYLTTLVAPKFVNSTTISAIQKRYGEYPAGWVARTIPILWNLETGIWFLGCF